MDENQPLPALKQGIEAVQFEHQGQPMIYIKDVEGLGSDGLGVSLGGFLLASLMDGKNSLKDVQSLFHKTAGALIQTHEIQQLVDQLDKAFLLETAALKEKREKIWREFLASPVRPMNFKNLGYPTNQMELAIQFGKYFKDSKGPQKELVSAPVQSDPLKGLISPHIDFARGGAGYAWAYQALTEYPKPDVIVALGVTHMSPPSPWVFTKKNYDTPYGPMETNMDLFNTWREKLWYDPCADEWVHRTEHSLEFQAVWLKYLWKEQAPSWLPILCSSFYSFCPDKAPSTVPTIEKAIVDFGNILEELRKQGKNVLVLAGVDLSHVGQRFGDKEKVTPELKQKIEEEDQKTLAHAFKLEADEFYLSAIENKNWRKWCGLSALYTFIRLVKMTGATKGQSLMFDVAEDPMGGIVSYTAGLFE